jgi:hypothetical protein
MERIDQSIRLDVEQTAPVSPGQAARGESSREEGRGRAKRPPRRAANAEAVEEELRQGDDRPHHRVDNEA